MELNYSVSGVDFQSVSEFEKNDFTGQKFGTNFSIGLAAIGSTLSFDTSNAPKTNLNYWLTEVGFDVGGLNVDNAFVLEVLEDSTAYGSGYKLSLSGELEQGARIYPASSVRAPGFIWIIISEWKKTRPRPWVWRTVAGTR